MASASSHQRQLVLVVEGTAALGHHWDLLRTEYLEKIIKSFCECDALNQKPSNSPAELALVVYYTHGPHSGCLLQQTGWTTNLDRFWQWISRINFAGGGFGDAAIAEGLAEALLMCCPTPVANTVSQVTDRQKHCILVAASNPHRLPTPIPRPPVQGLLQPSANSDPSAAEHWWLADADTVAKAFSQCSVSLSVVSPRQLLSLKMIFNGAKRAQRATDTPIEAPKYAHHMVLLSETFMEARQALAHSSAMPTTVLPKVEVSSATSIPPAQQASAVRTPAAGLVAGRPGTASGIIPTVPVKTEPPSVSGMVASGVTHAASLALLQNTVPVSLSMPRSSQAQDSSVVADSSVVQDLKTIGSGTVASSLRPGATGMGNVNLMPNSSQARPILGATIGNSLGMAGGMVSAGGLPMHGMLTSSSAASGVVSSSQTLLGVAQNGLGITNNQVGMGMGHNSAQGVGISGFNNPGNLVPSSAIGAAGNTTVSNVQVVGMGQSVGGLGQGNLSAGTTQIGSSGLVMGGQNVMPTLGSGGVNLSPPTMIPTPGIPPPVQGLQPMGAVGNNALQPIGAVNNNALQVPAPVVTPPQQANTGPKYAKIWVGLLTGRSNEKLVTICKLEAYRQLTSPETLAADWPSQMQITRLIPQEHMPTKYPNTSLSLSLSPFLSIFLVVFSFFFLFASYA
ncbi:hypothetical protein KP509_25G057700 [Ceratopteris richardii]|uniref:Mediator of RNA polymerase II transcription subunit 25 n=1 Tax=Ceratopteris richardii TaxID=49495 RepID=A0A8T2RQI4_CERRI|nr:hypothetical protein KP509_25G057700 [Ceratopteris richardii]